MRAGHAVAAAMWVVALCAAPAPVAAQFIPPPPPPPVLPPNYQQAPQQQMQMLQRTPMLGYRCITQAGVCVLQGPGYVGTLCTCAAPTGAPIPGQIIP
jgi:hypothetical protein